MNRTVARVLKRSAIVSWLHLILAWGLLLVIHLLPTEGEGWGKLFLWIFYVGFVAPVITGLGALFGGVALLLEDKKKKSTMLVFVANLLSCAACFIIWFL